MMGSEVSRRDRRGKKGGDRIGYLELGRTNRFMGEAAS